MRIVLMGLRGCGKSTLGARLAHELGVPFADLDDRVLHALGGATVADVWETHGEPAFRAAETAQLQAVLKTDSVVLALGGGAPTAPGAANILRDAASGGVLVVYLRCEPATLRDRLAASGAEDPNRPSLTGNDWLAEIDDVYARRDPLYRSLATMAITLDDVDALQAMELLRACVVNHQKNHG